MSHALSIEPRSPLYRIYNAAGELINLARSEAMARRHLPKGGWFINPQGETHDA
jgi:hypothetical protein